MDEALFVYIPCLDLIDVILSYTRFRMVDVSMVLRETKHFEEIDRYYRWKTRNGECKEQSKWQLINQSYYTEQVFHVAMNQFPKSIKEIYYYYRYYDSSHHTMDEERTEVVGLLENGYYFRYNFEGGSVIGSAYSASLKIFISSELSMIFTSIDKNDCGYLQYLEDEFQAFQSCKVVTNDDDNNSDSGSDTTECVPVVRSIHCFY